MKIASEIRPPSNSINLTLFLNQVSLLTAVKIAFSLKKELLIIFKISQLDILHFFLTTKTFL